jgi:glycine/D-amino acid oxidase-like deaminating enzyme
VPHIDLPPDDLDAALTADPTPADAHAPLDVATPVARRDFLKAAGSAGLLIAGGCAPPATFAKAPARGLAPSSGGSREHVVVIGAGAWGGWTAYHLRARGARVTLIDQYGPGNSRSTSGDETRGIRSSYGDRASGELWTPWARTAIARWQLFDKEWGPVFRSTFWHQTGDVILRATREPFINRTIELWQKNGVAHEVITGDEARKRYPIMKLDDITVGIVEPDAGVVRCRAATQAVASAAEKMGARLVLGRVRPGPIVNGQMDGVILDDGTVIRGDRYVFACGPWLRKLFPYMENRSRIPIGHALYFGVPQGDTRFQFPNMPSFNFPGVTGWPMLPTDSRGFRVRGAIAPAPGSAAAAAAAAAQQNTAPDPTLQDPDLSSRWTSQDRVDGGRRFLQARFPLLANAPLLETRACHYESSVNQNFIVDHLPDTRNAWIAGMGQAEGFKFGPVIGEYIAQRVLGVAGDPALADAFKLPTEQYERAPGE